MDPDLLKLREVFLSKFIYSLSESLVYLNVVSPQLLKLSVRQVSQIGLIERFEVVKQGFHDILVEVIVWQQFTHGHKDGITAFISQ